MNPKKPPAKLTKKERKEVERQRQAALLSAFFNSTAINSTSPSASDEVKQKKPTGASNIPEEVIDLCSDEETDDSSSSAKDYSSLNSSFKRKIDDDQPCTSANAISRNASRNRSPAKRLKKHQPKKKNRSPQAVARHSQAQHPPTLFNFDLSFMPQSSRTAFNKGHKSPEGEGDSSDESLPEDFQFKHPPRHVENPPRRIGNKKNKPQLTPTEKREKYSEYYKMIHSMKEIDDDDESEENECNETKKKTPTILKNVGNDLNVDYKFCTVQTGLRKFFKSHVYYKRLIKFIDRDVQFVTQQVRRFYLYLGCLFQENAENPEFFKRLNIDEVRKIYRKMNEGEGESMKFTELCTKHGIVVTGNRNHRAHLMNNALKTVWTSMKNCVEFNTERALKVHFNHLVPEPDTPQENYAKVQKTLNSRPQDNPWGYNFNDKKKNVMCRVPLLMDIQKKTTQLQLQFKKEGKSFPKGLRSYAVLPEAGTGLMHVQYDFSTFSQLLNQDVDERNAKNGSKIKKFDIPNKKTPAGGYTFQARALFARFVHFRKYEKWDPDVKPIPEQFGRDEDRKPTPNKPKKPKEPRRSKRTAAINYDPEAFIDSQNDDDDDAEDGDFKEPRPGPKTKDELRELRKKFNLCFTTNGMEVSIHFLRKEKSLPEMTVLTKSIGVDTGYKVFVAMAIVNKELHKDGHEEFQIIKCSSKSWHHATGHKEREKILAKIIGDVETKIAAERELIGDIQTGRAALDFYDHVDFELKHMALKEETYDGCRKYLRLRWQKKMAVRRTLDRTCERLVPKGCNTAVYYGNGPITSNTGGHVRCPLLKLYEAFTRIRRCRVFPTNEFRTSKLCCRCFHILHVQKVPKRFAYCGYCGLVVHRDSNASQNMVTVGKAQHHGGELPKYFNRSIWLPKYAQDKKRVFNGEPDPVFEYDVPEAPGNGAGSSKKLTLKRKSSAANGAGSSKKLKSVTQKRKSSATDGAVPSKKLKSAKVVLNDSNKENDTNKDQNPSDIEDDKPLKRQFKRQKREDREDREDPDWNASLSF